MDEDDSQDELINHSMSHNKGKRTALWAISDDSDNVEEESEEGESDSGEEDGEDHLEEEENHLEEEEEQAEDDDEEDEEGTKLEDGAFGETSADLARISSDEDSDMCPICLNSLNSQPVATPENCEHYFCLDCILEWAKNADSCPIDRIVFNSIYLRKCYGGKVKKIITVQKPVKGGQEVVDLDLEQTNCEVCGNSDREDRLLLCDGCDAGYHMECLTPPLHSVPVEEWFCPECEANNHRSRGSAEELSDTESLPSTARPTTSRPQHRAAGLTRAIARTQQSERVRANVNRHRITQLAPTYLIQSTWLDETINAVVAGLNTAVYIRDLTPRFPSSRRRKRGKRRNVKSKNTSSAKGKTGKARSGVRRKRKVRKSKSRKKQALKKTANPRSRISNNLGIVKDKKSSSIPTVYRPTEQTLSGMRADIGAASLSIYGDPFDLDPFVEREENDQQAHISSLLEAKRRGISHSALRSHQPVARPVTASLSRMDAMDVPQSRTVVEPAPVPDLLGSILSGQSILLMDSSDIIINRDGSLKAAKPIKTKSCCWILMMPYALKPGSSKSSTSGETSTQINSGISPSRGDSSLSLHYNNLPGSSCSSTNRLLSQSSSHLPSLSSHTPPPLHSDLLPRGHPVLQTPCPNQPIPFSGHRGSSGLGAPRETMSSSVYPTTDSSCKSKGMASSLSQPKSLPIKPMWVDVSVLPRIPKLKREGSTATNDDIIPSGNNKLSSSRANTNNSSTSSNGYGLPETGMNSLAGDKSRQQSVDQQKGKADNQPLRHRPDPDRTSSSAAFSNSFSSSSATGSPAGQPCVSSSSSAVSFRINSSGSSWYSRRLNIPSCSSSGGTMQVHWSEKEDEARKRQFHRDKQMLLASHTLVNKEQDSNIYDPFNPTLSDSSSSDGEAESSNLDSSSQCATHEGEAARLGSNEGEMQNKQNLVHVKAETQETEISQENPKKTDAQETTSPKLRCSEEYVKIEKESTKVDIKIEKQTELLDFKIKKELGLAGEGEAERVGRTREDTTLPAHHNLDFVTIEEDILGKESRQGIGTPSSAPSTCKNDSSAFSSAPTKKKQNTNPKSDSATLSKSPSRDLDLKKQTSKEQCFSSSETDRGRRGDHQSQGGRQKEKEDRKRSSRRSRSRERRRAHSASGSSQSNSPERGHRKRQRPRSHSKDRRGSRSASSSSSRERSRRKKHKQKIKEKNDGRERNHKRAQVPKDKRRGWSRSKSRSRSRSRSRSKSRSKDHKHARSRSKSRSRSRSRERRQDHTRLQQSSLSSRECESRLKRKWKHRSRSSSRERRKDEGLAKSSQKISGSCVLSSKDTKQIQDIEKEEDLIQSYPKEEKMATVNKQLSSCTSTKIKKEGEDLSVDSLAPAAELTKELKVEIKKEKHPSLDMFEDFPITQPIKKKEMEIPLAKAKGVDVEGMGEYPIKTEACEVITIKSEPGSPELCHLSPVASFSSLITPVTADSQQDAVSQALPGLMASAEQPNTAGLTVSVKQEVLQPSDSDDDFSVDVMIDNLDYVKSECMEGNDASIKQDKEEEEGKNEEQVSTLMGAKAKTQVKRVTWNIQEPERPQPEKSASKLALYKLKLKQEGARRTSSSVQTGSQNITGADSDPSKKGAVGPLSAPSRNDGLNSEDSSISGQRDEEEGDLSRKEKYLKKLHMQERAIEEVKLAIKPFYQRRDINKDEYKEILRKAVQKVCHSKSGEINPVKVGNLVKAYVDKYKHARKYKKGEDLGKAPEVQTQAMKTSESP
ncbi:PHD and RING finger domain-containing protein 1 isoform X2 [Mastacembelus armatus]|uniref:PHD and RING finger domain-containing protein 1 isoform X2 n=1 Tax=Mastacembelus armatus TaxID=205130 RepID=UPI000E455D94|nr:PHD and RING finger domain-containing protein 1 isoform X2 [Mastacembelus armatus]